MPKKSIKHIDKTMFGRLQDCEVHVLFLDEALTKCDHNPIYYKQVAAELRVLVADGNSNNRILFNIMKDLNLDYKFDYIDRRITLEEYCEQSVFLNHQEFTFCALIKNIAENEGSSHESSKLPVHLAIGHSFQVNGLPIHIQQLISIGKVVNNVSKELFKYLNDQHLYSSQYLIAK